MADPTTFTNTWDETTPGSSTTMAATQITDFKTDVRERANAEHYAYSSETGNDDTWSHRKGASRLNYGTAASRPSTTAGGQIDGAFYWATDTEALTYYNGTSWVTLSWGGTHAANHITSGSDEIDGDQLDIDWNPTTYTPATTPSEASSADHLTAHLYGIDQELAVALHADGSVALSADWDAGAHKITAEQLAADIADGTAPLIITSTTVVPNLNVDQVDGKDSTDLVLVDGTQALTANWDAGSFKITAETFASDVATGTAPFTVASTTKVTNLNADTVDGYSPQAYHTQYVDAAAMVARTTNGAEAATEEYATNDVMVDHYLFDTTTSEGVQFKWMLPDEWDRGTVKVKVFWDAASGASAADQVSWGVRAAAVSDDDAIDGSWGTAVTTDDTVTAVGDCHVTPATGALTVGGTPALGDMTFFEVYRNVGGNDNMTEDAKLLGIAIQYGVDTSAASQW